MSDFHLGYPVSQNGQCSHCYAQDFSAIQDGVITCSACGKKYRRQSLFLDREFLGELLIEARHGKGTDRRINILLNDISDQIELLDLILDRKELLEAYLNK